MSYLMKQRVLFAIFSTAIYLGLYREAFFRHLEFQLAAYISFPLAIYLWRFFMENRTAKASRIIAFSVIFGILHFFQILMTVTIFQLPNTSQIFTHTMLGFFASQYILTGVVGISKSILICVIATSAAKAIWVFSQKNTVCGQYQEHTIIIQHDFYDRLEVSLDNHLLFKQKKQIIFDRTFKFELPIDGQILDGAVTIKKHFFNCKTGIKLLTRY